MKPDARLCAPGAKGNHRPLGRPKAAIETLPLETHKARRRATNRQLEKFVTEEKSRANLVERNLEQQNSVIKIQDLTRLVTPQNQEQAA
jgi:hypothetical protein